MAAMRYKGSVFITFIFFSVVLLQCPLAHSSSTSSFFWLAETEYMNAMKKEHEIDVGSANEAEERKVPTGSDPLHHHHTPFASP
ncbi:CLAVATA3/ESR (CLE)-related protein 40-like [Raphanus sativus]|uniref:CLAVATA3/ESR (CLE)-related protein 40-like n=1 Tax=Raphanus sativus TaxID=3726 RepID=A0A6J0KB48_RAPSA|nr:CLAVATA3/ESR (CLE)-related protein 40-like [Raphanus sativus]